MTSYFLSTGKTLLDEYTYLGKSKYLILVMKSKMITLATFVFNQNLFNSWYKNKIKCCNHKNLGMYVFHARTEKSTVEKDYFRTTNNAQQHIGILSFLVDQTSRYQKLILPASCF